MRFVQYYIADMKNVIVRCREKQIEKERKNKKTKNENTMSILN